MILNGTEICFLGALSVILFLDFLSFTIYAPVSYTHLDVYKRQNVDFC